VYVQVKFVSSTNTCFSVTAQHDTVQSRYFNSS